MWLFLGATVFAASNIALTPHQFPLELQLRAPAKDIVASKANLVDQTVQYKFKTKILQDNVPTPTALNLLERGRKQIGQEIVEKRTEYYKIFKVANSEEFVFDGIAGLPQFYKEEDGTWWKADYATTTIDAFMRQTKGTQMIQLGQSLFRPAHIAFAQTTLYPDASSVDGRVINIQATAQTWATIRAGTGTHGIDNEAQDTIMAIESGATCDSDPWARVGRGVLGFAQSVGTISSTTSATLSAVGFGKADNLVIVPNVNIYSADPTSNTALQAKDFGRLGTTTPFATTVAYLNLTSDGSTYTDFPFNNDGLAYITAAVNTPNNLNFGVRNKNYDADNVEPTCTVTENDSNWRIKFSETADVTADPKLVFTFTAAAAAGAPYIPVGNVF